MKTGRTYLEFKTERVVEHDNKVTVIESAVLDTYKSSALRYAINIPFIRELLLIESADKFDGRYIYFNTKVTAKCAPNDVYNAKTGYNLAITKAQKNIFKQYSDLMKNILTFFDDTFYNEFEKLYANGVNAKYNAEDHVREIINR